MAQNPLFLLMVIIMPLRAFVGTVVDGQMKVRDSAGYSTWISTSNYSGQLFSALMVIATLYALLVITHDSLGSRRLGRLPVVVLVWPLLLAVAQVTRGEYLEAVMTASSTLIVVAIAIIGITMTALRIAGRIIVLVGIAASVFALANPERSLVPCRDDKCSIVGGLLTSFFPQENVLALYMILGLGLVAFVLHGAERVAGAFLIVILISASGSRTMMVASAVLILIKIILAASKGSTRATMLRFIGGSVVVLFLSSTVLFFASVTDSFLTGRGFIYALLRDYWLENPTLGPGRSVLLEAFRFGDSANFLVSHEHGGAPYLLINGGLITTFAFFYWLVKLVKNFSESSGLATDASIVMSLMVGLVSLTEPVWQIDVETPGYWSLALVSAVYATRHKVGLTPTENHRKVPA